MDQIQIHLDRIHYTARCHVHIEGAMSKSPVRCTKGLHVRDGAVHVEIKNVSRLGNARLLTGPIETAEGRRDLRPQSRQYDIVQRFAHAPVEQHLGANRRLGSDASNRT
jgi:hypothetical protein